MSDISIRLFAILRDRIGQETELVSVADPVTVRRLLDALVLRHPDLAVLMAHCRVAVNRKFCPEDHVIQESDEVAIIPPLSGG